MSCVYIFLCVCVLGAGESRESVKAWIYSEGGGEQQQAAQRDAGPTHNHWNIVTAKRWPDGIILYII